MTLSLTSSLWHDVEISTLFSAEAEIASVLRYETALAEAQAEIGLLNADAATAISNACSQFKPDLMLLQTAIARDGLAVPELIGQLRQALPQQYSDKLHFHATSQDAIDTTTILACGAALSIMELRLLGVVEQLATLSAQSGDVKQMARTRFQRALPITVAERLGAWVVSLRYSIEQLATLRSQCLMLQIGGPIGTDPSPWAEALARRLGLAAPTASWQTARGRIVQIGTWAAVVSGSLGKIGADIALMAQNEIAEVEIAGGGTSSAMTHKSNPVAAEILVALARYNATLIAGLHQSMVHEQERSGSAWTLEWIVLPQMLECTGAALRHTRDLFNRVKFR
jgi:3-carboxy-cis,cis-muconate cycloisomerase